MTKRSGARWYHRRNLISELSAAKLWLAGRGRIFHFLYGENSYRYLGMLKRLGTRNSIVCTYHAPHERFAEVVKDTRHLEHLDAVIVVSNLQRDIFAPFVGADRVFFVPHGIDVDYFKPAGARTDIRQGLECLFVGTHLRDLDTLAETARLLELRPDVRFVVVTQPDNFARFAGLRRVQCLTGIDDGALLALYQRADLLVFPLLDCTANNTLLESMACGLPAVTTDLAGVRDYVSKDCAILTPKRDPRALAEAIVGLTVDRQRLLDMGRCARARAMDFCWETVAGRTVEVYDWLRNHPRRA